MAPQPTLPWSSCHRILDTAHLQGSELTIVIIATIVATGLELSVAQAVKHQRLPFDLLRKYFAGSAKTQYLIGQDMLQRDLMCHMAEKAVARG